MRSFRLSIGALTMFAASVATAAEPSMELPAGGLVYAALQTLMTKQESITIGADSVRVTYSVTNLMSDANRQLMVFALPDLDMLALDGAAIANSTFDPANPYNFVGFSASADGLPVEAFVEARALSLGLIDGTARLRELGLPLYPLHPEMGERLAALPEDIRKELTERAMIRMGDGQPEAMWTLKTTLSWAQPFAANQTKTIAIAYRPISGTGTWSIDTAATLQQRYCVPQQAADAFNQRAAAGDLAEVRTIQFLAGAGATSRGTVGDYRIAMMTAGAQQTAFTCRQGLIAQGLAGGRGTTQAEAMPDDEIHLLFVD